MGSLFRDFRLAVRVLLKSPAFTLSAVSALALGIGANSAIFSVVNAVLFRPLPYSEPDRLVTMFGSDRSFRQSTVSPADYVQWRAQTKVFDELACYTGGSFNLAGGDRPARVEGTAVSANIFRTLGVNPALGRPLLDEENERGRNRVVVISYSLWQRVFNADPEILGKTIRLDEENYSIVGVMPETFRFVLKTDLITPLQIDPNYRANSFLRLVGRLKSGVTLEQARAELQVLGSRLDQTRPGPNPAVDVVPLHELTAEKSRLVLLVLFGAVGFVLLIACANIANLLLARAATRRKEMAIRAALGASRFDLVRQLLIESLLLGIVSGGAGLILAAWGIDIMVKLAPDTLPQVNAIGIDAPVFGFTFVVSVATSVLFGIFPALHTTRLDITIALKEGARSSQSGFVGLGFRNLLVVGQVALALILLIGAGLMLNSLLRLLNVNKGFDPNNLLTMNVSLPSAYRTSDRMSAFYSDALRRLNETPGVVTASSVNQLPLGSMGLMGDFQVEGERLTDDSAWARKVITGDRYFETMRIPLLRGREFDERDNVKSEPVAVVNETFALANFGQEDPLGRRISIDQDSQQQPIWRKIVGITSDVAQGGLTQGREPAIFVPYSQTSKPFWLDFTTFVIRTDRDPEGVAAAAEGQIRAVDPDLPAYSVRTMRQVILDSVSDPRFDALLLAVFAALALSLAAVGIYGVISYSVAQRTHEMGIRMALGAAPGDVVRLVARQGVGLATVGVGLGLLGALGLTRFVSSLLYGISATDTLTFGAVAAFLMMVALVATLVPARRASKVDPIVALRWE
jgi:putative ABC transport system permease protein